MKPLNRSTFSALVIALYLLPPSCANAETVRDLPIGGFVDAASLEDLLDMVVTDTKVPQSRNTVTQNIAVLHQEDFEQQTANNRNIAELLNYTSGQFVNVLSRNDANWGSYAGLGAKYNSYLLDGLPIDSFVDAMSLDPWAFERIEAHKGPASVMYSNYLSMDFAGNESPLAGTTNLILKDRIDKTLSRFQASYGSYGTLGGRAYHQGRQGNLSYFFGMADERSDYTQYGASNSWLQTVEAADYNKLKGYAKLSYAIDREDHLLSLFVHHTQHSGDMGRPNRDFDHRYNTLNLAYSNQISKTLNLQFKTGKRDYDRQSGEDNYPTSLALTGRGITTQHIRPTDIALSYQHAEGALLTAGADRQTVEYSTASISPSGVLTPQNEVTARSVGIYVQEKMQLGDWVIRGGLRRNTIDHDYTLLGGNAPTTASAAWRVNLWSLGMRYNHSPTFSVYANSGTSFMPPAAKQIGGTLSSPTSAGQIPNPALNPEHGFGQDLGIDWWLNPSTSLGARAFANKISDAIVDNVVSLSPSQTQASNSGSATASGIEIDLKQTLSDTTQWFANLTASSTRINSPGNADQNGSDIPFAPDRVVNVGLNTRLAGGITLSPYFHWVGKYWDSTARSSRLAFGNYGVLNVRLQKQLRGDEQTGLSVFAELNNLTDQRFDMPWGFRDPGFNAFAGLNASF